MSEAMSALAESDAAAHIAELLRNLGGLIRQEARRA